MLSKYLLSPFLGLYLVFFIFSFINGEMIKYENYRVYRIFPSSQQKLDVILSLRTSGDSLIFLDDTFKIGYRINVAVAPHRLPDFRKLMQTYNINYWLKESNLQNALEANEVQVHESRPSYYGWRSYYNLNSTYNWLYSLEHQYTNDYTLYEYGKTSGGNDLLFVRISDNSDWEPSSKSENRFVRPAIFLIAGEHGNEWISSAVATYIINELLTSDNVRVRNAVYEYDWYIVPHANPDGYEYTRTTDPLWSKTRSSHGSCFGVDLNRNWGGPLPDSDITATPCSRYYQGPKPLSEPETKGLSEMLTSYKKQIKLVISLHGFSKKLLYPSGRGSVFDADDMERVSKAALGGLKGNPGTSYSGENDFLKCNDYVGTAMNWVRTDPKMGIKMAFTFELGDRNDGTIFKDWTPWRQIAASRIQPIGEEFFNSLFNMTNELEDMGYFQLEKGTETLPLRKYVH